MIYALNMDFFALDFICHNILVTLKMNDSVSQFTQSWMVTEL